MAVNNKGLFYRFTEALQKSGDIALAYAFQKEEMKRILFERQERERLIEDTADRVLSRINATVDVSDIIMRIDDLQDRINRLGK